MSVLSSFKCASGRGMRRGLLRPFLRSVISVHLFTVQDISSARMPGGGHGFREEREKRFELFQFPDWALESMALHVVAVVGDM